MTEHVINDTKTQDGQMVHYTGHDGKRREALVKRLHSVIYRADLQVTNDEGGGSVFLENVPFGEAGVHSWNHIPEQEQAEMQRGNADAPTTKPETHQKHAKRE